MDGPGSARCLSAPVHFSDCGGRDKEPQKTYPNLPPQMAEKCAEELQALTKLSITRKTREYRMARERYRRDGL